MSIFSALGSGVSHAMDFFGSHGSSLRTGPVDPTASPAPHAATSFFAAGGGAVHDIMSAVGHYADFAFGGFPGLAGRLGEEVGRGHDLGWQREEDKTGRYAYVNRNKSGLGV